MNHEARKLGRFYTPAEVAAELVSMVDDRPTSVLDLGCGAGALSLAAVGHWGAQINLATIDVDAEAGPGDGHWSRRHLHFTADVLSSDPFLDLLTPASFDLVLLNPPYGRQRGAGRAMSGFAGKCTDPPGLASHCRATAFMLHALRAARTGGAIAAILPESLATSGASASSRAAISRFALVERLAILPARTFAGTEARTVITILRKTPEKTMDDAPWWIADRGLECPGQGKLRTLGDLGVEVVRGRLNTVEARQAGAFHLDGFRAATNGFVRFDAKPRLCLDERSAREGDILIARVGRGIPDRIAQVSSGANAISDCVFRVRCTPALAPRVWAGLRSNAGREQLERAQAGLTARFLPMGGLLSIGV